MVLLNHGTFRSATHLADNTDLRQSRQQEENVYHDLLLPQSLKPIALELHYLKQLSGVIRDK